MNVNPIPVLQTIVTILAIFAMIWKFRKDLLTEVDKKFEALEKRFEAIDKRFDAIDRRFDKIEATLETVQQNHLDHITQLHVSPHGVASTTDTPEKSS